MITVSIILLNAFCVMAAENLTLIEDKCTNCTAHGSSGFYKIMWLPSAPAEYVCRSSATIGSKYGIIVDKACTPFDCIGIESRPFVKSVSVPGTCGITNVYSPAEYGYVSFVRDILEIMIIIVFLVILILRGDWIKGFEILQNRRKLRQEIVQTMYENHLPNFDFVPRPPEDGAYDEVDHSTGN